jgi:hypothetical protein
VKISVKWKWTYKPGRVAVIGFFVLSLVAGYAAQVLIKQEFLSGISSCVVFDKNNKVYFDGVLLSVVNKSAKETRSWILNPLENWEMPVLLFGVFIAIGAIIIFYKSRLLLLEYDKAEFNQMVKGFEETIQRKNAYLGEMDATARSRSAETDNLKKTLAQYKASYDSMSRENTAMKEQSQAVLAKKDQEHVAEKAVMKVAFAETILTMKNQWNASLKSDTNSI